MKTILFGSRSSRLATLQVKEIEALLARHNIECPYTLKTYQSRGDKDQVTPLTANAGDDFFTDTLDQALLNGEVDITIHSAKDLPRTLAPGLSIFALTKSLDETEAFVGKHSLSLMTEEHLVGTSSPLRQQQIKELNPRVQTVSIRGTIEDRIRQVEAGTVDGVVIATVALKRLGLEQHIREILPWESTPLQGQLAVVGRTQDEHLRKLFEPIDIRTTYGSVTLVGAGPGDPDLITLKGVKALHKADCVLYDYLVHKSILEHAPQAEKIYVGKRKGDHAMRQSELSRLIRHKAMEGKYVVRLKGGDPLVFGRGGDEIEYLRNYHFHVDVIAGVSSATAISSQMGIPLTARHYASSVAFVSAHQAEELEGTQPKSIRIPDTDTVVFFMGLSKLSHIVEALLQSGRTPTTPMAIVSNGTRVNERAITATVGTILKHPDLDKLSPPALIIVGDTVKFYRPGPQPKPTLLYTGTNPAKYQPLGRVIHWPMIRISGVSFPVESSAALMNKYDIILLTSRFAVEHFAGPIQQHPEAYAQLQQKDIVVIGKDTADALMRFGLTPRHIAQTETSEGVYALLSTEYELDGKRVLFPRSNLPNPFLKEQLAKLNCAVDEMIVYKNECPPVKELPKEHIDQIVFTSPSTVKNFLHNYQSIPPQWDILCKGPVTQKALTEAGYKSQVIIHG